MLLTKRSVYTRATKKKTQQHTQKGLTSAGDEQVQEKHGLLRLEAHEVVGLGALAIVCAHKHIGALIRQKKKTKEKINKRHMRKYKLPFYPFGSAVGC